VNPTEEPCSQVKSQKLLLKMRKKKKVKKYQKMKRLSKNKLQHFQKRTKIFWISTEEALQTLKTCETG